MKAREKRKEVRKERNDRGIGGWDIQYRGS